MIEVLYVLYLFSGVIKAYLQTLNVGLPIDFTILSAILLLGAVGLKKPWVFSKENIFRLFKHRILIAFLAFWLWMIITNIYSSSPSYSIYKSFVFGTNLVALVVPLLTGVIRFKLLGQAIFALAFILGVLFFFLYPITLYGRPSDYRMLDFDAFHGEYQAIGILVSISIIYLLTRKITMPIALALNVMVWVLLYSGSRGSMIFLGMTVLFMFGVRYKNLLPRLKHFDISKLVRAKLVATLILLLLINAGYVWVVVNNAYPSKVHYRSFARMGLAVNSLLESSERDNVIRIFNMRESEGSGNDQYEEFNENSESKRNTSITARIYHYKFSIQKITTSLKRFIFGYGIGSYGIEFSGKDSRGYPHNILLETWFEMGLVGVLLIVFFIITYVQGFRYDNVFLFAALVFVLLNLLKSSSLVDIRLFFGLLSCTLLPLSNQPKPANDS